MNLVRAENKSSQSREQSVLFSSYVQYQVLRKAKTSIQKLEQTLCSLLKMKGNCKYLQVFAWTKSLDMVYMYLLNRDIYTAEPIKALQPTVALVVAISKGQ